MNSFVACDTACVDATVSEAGVMLLRVSGVVTTTFAIRAFGTSLSRLIGRRLAVTVDWRPAVDCIDDHMEVERSLALRAGAHYTRAPLAAITSQALLPAMRRFAREAALLGRTRRLFLPSQAAEAAIWARDEAVIYRVS